MAKTSLFANVKSIGTPATPAKGKEKGEVTVKGVQQYAELVALQSAIAAILGTMEAEIKGTAFDMFIETAKETHTSPESFNGVEGIATVNMQMRKRGTNSPLNQSELDVLKAAGIAAFEQTSVQELYAINPKFAEDNKLLAKVSKALEKIVPEDFIVKQEKKAKMVVSEDTLNAAFKMSTIDPDVIKVVTTMALKPKLVSVDIDTILEDVSALLGATVTKQAATTK